MTESKGLFNSVKTLLGTLLGMAQTRLELIANEMEEERIRMIRLLFSSLIMLFFLCQGVVLLTVLILALYWDNHRLLSIGLVTTFYLVTATWLATSVRQQIKQRPKLFITSIAEIAKDRAALDCSSIENEMKHAVEFSA